MIKKVTEAIIYDLCNKIKAGKLNTLTIEKVFSKNKTLIFNANYEEYDTVGWEDITQKHLEAINILQEFNHNYKAGLVKEFSFHKDGDNFSYLTSFNDIDSIEYIVSDTIKSLIDIIDNNPGIKLGKVSADLGKILKTLKKKGK